MRDCGGGGHRSAAVLSPGIGCTIVGTDDEIWGVWVADGRAAKEETEGYKRNWSSYGGGCGWVENIRT